MIKVSRRYIEHGFFRYEYKGEFKTYAEAVRHFSGEQDWYDKKCHRFTVNGELYVMTKK